MSESYALTILLFALIVVAMALFVGYKAILSTKKGGDNLQVIDDKITRNQVDKFLSLPASARQNITNEIDAGLHNDV